LIKYHRIFILKITNKKEQVIVEYKQIIKYKQILNKNKYINIKKIYKLRLTPRKIPERKFLSFLLFSKYNMRFLIG
jgi:hypothetical protein